MLWVLVEVIYDAFCNRLLEDEFQKTNESDSDESSGRPQSESLHTLSEGDFTNENFDVDGLDDSLTCDYCEKPFREGKGNWDSGLQMMLCRYCRIWWDTYGHYATAGGGSGVAYPLSTYEGGQA